MVLIELLKITESVEDEMLVVDAEWETGRTISWADVGNVAQDRIIAKPAFYS